jgi:hypothetical protein
MVNAQHAFLVEIAHGDSLVLGMMSAQTLRVCREGKPVPTFCGSCPALIRLTGQLIRIRSFVYE